MELNQSMRRVPYDKAVEYFKVTPEWKAPISSKLKVEQQKIKNNLHNR